MVSRNEQRKQSAIEKLFLDGHKANMGQKRFFVAFCLLVIRPTRALDQQGRKKSLQTINYQQQTINYSSVVSPAPKYSRFRRAMLDTEIPLGHSASQA